MCQRRYPRTWLVRWSCLRVGDCPMQVNIVPSSCLPSKSFTNFEYDIDYALEQDICPDPGFPGSIPLCSLESGPEPASVVPSASVPAESLDSTSSSPHR